MVALENDPVGAAVGGGTAWPFSS